MSKRPVYVRLIRGLGMRKCECDVQGPQLPTLEAHMLEVRRLIHDVAEVVAGPLVRWLDKKLTKGDPK